MCSACSALQKTVARTGLVASIGEIFKTVNHYCAKEIGVFV
jgi:hypothetical protein